MRSESISKELRIFEIFPDHASISPGKKAWITIKAKQRGLDPKSVHAGIKARYKKIRNTIIGR